MKAKARPLLGLCLLLGLSDGCKKQQQQIERQQHQYNNNSNENQQNEQQQEQRQWPRPEKSTKTTTTTTTTKTTTTREWYCLIITIYFNHSYINHSYIHSYIDFVFIFLICIEVLFWYLYPFNWLSKLGNQIKQYSCINWRLEKWEHAKNNLSLKSL